MRTASEMGRFPTVIRRLKNGIGGLLRTHCLCVRREKMTIEINDQSFEAEVLKSDLPVVVDFWAPWCGPCRMVGPVIDKLAEDFNGKVKFCKLNVDENGDMSTKYQVRSIPLILFFKAGEVVDQNMGAAPDKALRPKVQALL